jgi:hypothetical protein
VLANKHRSARSSAAAPVCSVAQCASKRGTAALRFLLSPDMSDDVPPSRVSSLLNSKAYTIVGLTLVLDPIDRRGSSA